MPLQQTDGVIRFHSSCILGICDLASLQLKISNDLRILLIKRKTRPLTVSYRSHGLLVMVMSYRSDELLVIVMS